jgi:hypothetical protein
VSECQYITKSTAAAVQLGERILSRAVKGLANSFIVSIPVRNFPCHPREVTNQGLIAVMASVNAIPHECYKRGDFEIAYDQKSTTSNGGQREKAIAVTTDGDLITQSQYIAFFTSDDCEPKNAIDNAWLDEGCSNNLPNNPKDWASWAVWDMCEDKPGCDLTD